MKLLHLSDLHIGKRIYEFSMADDQRYILNEILSIAEHERAEGVLLAGDIYDKSVPSADAVQILDEFLTGLALKKIKVFAISGNHDCAERIAFGAQLMNRAGVYLSPVYTGKVQKVTLKDDYGEVDIHLLPFLKPSYVRQVYEDEKIETYQDALAAAIEHMEIDLGKRNVLVAHQFVTGAERSESEDIQAGGLDNVDASLFDAFDYVALGHIHKPQCIGRETVRYCGTPLKYSFSEAGHEKSVTVVELKEKGNVELHCVPLCPLRELRQIRGTYAELTARSFYQGTNVRDYIQAVLTDEDDVPDAAAKLRVIYPNLMHLSYDNNRTRQDASWEAGEGPENKTQLELFEEFYELQNNRPMEDWQRSFVRKLTEELAADCM